MPRSVFRLLWDRISAGQEIFAYVMNLSADGSHYWVLAHVTPTCDAAGSVVGYHSNRRTASPGVIAQVSALYQRLLAEEARHSSAREACDAGFRLLEQELETAGVGYDEWVWALSNDDADGRAAA